MGMEQPRAAAAGTPPPGEELQWTPNPDDPAALAPGQALGPYTVRARLGHGAHAVVYRVERGGLDFALKVLSKADAGLRERLIQEGKIQAQLRHPNTVAVLEVLQLGDTVGLVMDYVDGPTLHQWLRAQRPDIATALTVFRGVAEGVGAAHALGIVHRDVKPGNVLLQLGDGLPTPRVCDFGLAKVEDPTGAPTDEGRSMGTPGYMAPEQIVDWKNVDRRADIFSLGCVLYELLAGRRPFRGGEARVMCEAILAGQYPAPEDLIPELPEHLRLVIRRCLAVERLRRPPSCAVLLRLLDDPDPAPPPPGTLAARLGGEPLPLVEAVTLVSALAATLAPAHAAGDAHGDIRPGRVALDGPALSPAEPFSVDHPGSAEQLAHLAPERLREQPISPATDQYGLAMLVVAAIHGAQLRIDALLDTRHLLLGLDAPPQALRVLARALSADPTQRHESAEAFVRALGAATADAIARPGRGDELREEELLAVDGELPRRVEKEAPPWRMAVFAGLFLVLVGGLAWTLGQPPPEPDADTAPTWTAPPAEVGDGSMFVRLPPGSGLATLRCSGGRQASFHNELRLRFLKPMDCVIELDEAEGVFTVRAPGEIRCEVRGDNVLCTPVKP